MKGIIEICSLFSFFLSVLFNIAEPLEGRVAGGGKGLGLGGGHGPDGARRVPAEHRRMHRRVVRVLLYTHHIPMK